MLIEFQTREYVLIDRTQDQAGFNKSLRRVFDEKNHSFLCCVWQHFFHFFTKQLFW